MESTGDSVTNILDLCPDLKTLVPSAGVLWQTIRGAINVSKAAESWEYFLKIKNMILSKATVSQIRSVCQQCPEKWVQEFGRNLTTKSIDPQMACSTLEKCFEKQFQTISLQMLGNAVIALNQSIRAWKLVYDFQIPSCQKQIEQVRVYLNNSAAVLNRIIGNLNDVQREELQRAQNWLTDAKNVLETVILDYENKIREAKQYRSNNVLSAVINGVSTVVDAMIFRSMATQLATVSWTTATSGLSTAIHAGCTIGDLIAANKADELVEKMQTELNNINQLEVERTRISTGIQVLLH